MADFFLIPIYFALFFLLASPILLINLLITLVVEIPEKCRRSCPVHKEQFQYEILEVHAEEVEENWERIYRRRRMKEIPEEHYRDLASTHFPYANPSRPEYIKAGIHRHRYCPSCRKAEQDF